MNRVTKLIGASALLIFSNLTFAQYFKTLPKGVRTIDMRNIKTSTIDSSYNHSESESPFSYDIELDSKTLKAIDNEIVQTIFSVLEPYQDAGDALNLGKYHLEAEANMEVDVFGFGWGLTNRVTAYIGLPIHKADVKMKYQRKQGNNYGEVAEILQDYTGDDFAQGIGQNIEAYGQNLDIDGAFIQNLVVNHFNYEEVGDWHGEGPGDVEFGTMYNFLNQDNYGLLVTFGGVAPTGRVDDPDIIQDVAFGDGQWDAFLEFGGGAVVNNWLIVNSWFRYTHQFASQKELRVPLSEEVFIGDEKANFYEKLGDKFIYHVSTDFKVNDWINLSTGYEYSHTEAARYTAENSKYSYAEDILASNTESVQHNVRASVEFSTVTPFSKGKFLLPASIKFSYQHMVEGRNTAKYDRYELGYRMFF